MRSSYWNRRMNRKMITLSRFGMKNRNEEGGWRGGTSIRNEEKLLRELKSYFGDGEKDKGQEIRFQNEDRNVNHGAKKIA